MEASLNLPVPGCNASSPKSAPLQNMRRTLSFSLLYPTIGLPSRNQTGCRCQILLSASGRLLLITLYRRSQMALSSIDCALWYAWISLFIGVILKSTVTQNQITNLYGNSLSKEFPLNE